MFIQTINCVTIYTTIQKFGGSHLFFIFIFIYIYIYIYILLFSKDMLNGYKSDSEDLYC